MSIGGKRDILYGEPSEDYYYKSSSREYEEMLRFEEQRRYFNERVMRAQAQMTSPFQVAAPPTVQRVYYRTDADKRIWELEDEFWRLIQKYNAEQKAGCGIDGLARIDKERHDIKQVYERVGTPCDCGKKTVLKKGSYGYFVGCPQFPSCTVAWSPLQGKTGNPPKPETKVPMTTPTLNNSTGTTPAAKTGAKKVANELVKTCVDTTKKEGSDAMWRTAAMSAVQLAKEPVMGFVQKQNLGKATGSIVKTFLGTDVGEAALAVAMGMGLSALPTTASNAKVTRLASELRILGMTTVTNMIAGMMMEPVRKALTDFLVALPDDSAP